VRQEQQPAKLGEQLSLFLSIYPARMRFGQYGKKKSFSYYCYNFKGLSFRQLDNTNPLYLNTY
jgi:hypothetical protein